MIDRLWICYSTVFTVIGMSLCFSGCLKTRIQLRENQEIPEITTPLMVEEPQNIYPSGQYLIEELKAEMTRLSGRLEESEKTQAEWATHLQTFDKNDHKKLEMRVTQLEQEQTNILESLKKIEENPLLFNPIELYQQAKLAYSHHDYSGALKNFEGYLKTTKPKHMTEAVFYLAESYYYLKKYKQAIVEYSKISEKWPQSSYVAHALYQMGLCFEALGMNEDAEGFYQELLIKHPKSPEAKKLKKLKPSTSKKSH